MADQRLTEEAVGLVGEWLAAAGGNRRDRAAAGRLRRLLSDAEGTAFTMGFVDRVIRPERNRVAARQLRSLVVRRGVPAFLSVADRALLAIGARLAPLAPWAVMPLARRRMRRLVGHLLAEAEPTVNMAPGEREEHVSWALDILTPNGSGWADGIVGERKAALEGAHRRLRRAVDGGGAASVEPHPPDIIGCYVLVPAGG